MLLIDRERAAAEGMGTEMTVRPPSRAAMLPHPDNVADFIDKAVNELG